MGDPSLTGISVGSAALQVLDYERTVRSHWSSDWHVARHYKGNPGQPGGSSRYLTAPTPRRALLLRSTLLRVVRIFLLMKKSANLAEYRLLLGLTLRRYVPRLRRRTLHARLVS